MRPTYETDEDIKYESHVADVFASKHNMQWEIKCRKVKKEVYETYMISASKVIAARALTDATGLSCILIVKWKDQAGWINFKEKPNSVGFGGRVDRGDNQDMEPVVYYDIDRFKEV